MGVRKKNHHIYFLAHSFSNFSFFGGFNQRTVRAQYFPIHEELCRYCQYMSSRSIYGLSTHLQGFQDKCILRLRFTTIARRCGRRACSSSTTDKSSRNANAASPTTRRRVPVVVSVAVGSDAGLGVRTTSATWCKTADWYTSRGE